jgi:hypothetical protein
MLTACPAIISSAGPIGRPNCFEPWNCTGKKNSKKPELLEVQAFLTNSFEKFVRTVSMGPLAKNLRFTIASTLSTNQVRKAVRATSQASSWANRPSPQAEKSTEKMTDWDR